MVVGNKNRTCLAEARWSGRQPECREINCGPPGERESGSKLIFSNYFIEEKSEFYRVGTTDFIKG